jgi:hypothetical protein
LSSTPIAILILIHIPIHILGLTILPSVDIPRSRDYLANFQVRSIPRVGAAVKESVADENISLVGVTVAAKGVDGAVGAPGIHITETTTLVYSMHREKKEAREMHEALDRYQYNKK